MEVEEEGNKIVEGEEEGKIVDEEKEEVEGKIMVEEEEGKLNCGGEKYYCSLKRIEKLLFCMTTMTVKK